MDKEIVESIMDPRGAQRRNKLKLAKRATLEELKKGPVLFYNNTKLRYASYIEVFSRIKRRFAELGITNFIDVEETVRGKSTQQLKEYGISLVKKTRPKGVVVALGDMGTSPATSIVTMGIEEAGVPAVYITAPPGSDLVRSTVFYRAGHLCLTSLDIYQGSTPEDIDREVDKNIQRIIGSLTYAPEELEEIANFEISIDKQPPSDDGLIDLDKIHGFNSDLRSEPGAFIEEIDDFFASMSLTDGLPMIPPTLRRYERMMEYCPWSADTVVASEIGPAGTDITIKDLAVAAVMAGARPTAMPILVTAFKAMNNKNYNFLQSVSTSHPGGNMILVSGPIAKQVGLYGGPGCLGPGPWANAAIGRAANLVLINRSRVVPGVSDLDCLASQAEFTYAFAEDRSLTPWETINAEHFDPDTTTVYVLKAEPPHDIIDFISQNGGDLMDTITYSCTTLGSNNATLPGPLVVVLTPDHAELLSRDGWNKEKIREHIHKWATTPTAMSRNRGLSPATPKEYADMHPMPATRSPDDVEVVVAGNRGGHSAVILPWALHSEGIVEPLALPNGKIARKIEDFRVKGN